MICSDICELHNQTDQCISTTTPSPKPSPSPTPPVPTCPEWDVWVRTVLHPVDKNRTIHQNTGMFLHLCCQTHAIIYYAIYIKYIYLWSFEPFPSHLFRCQQNETFVLCECIMAKCIENDTIVIVPLECPPLKEITCASGKEPVIVKDKSGCCDYYTCPCEFHDMRFYLFTVDCTHFLLHQCWIRKIPFLCVIAGECEGWGDPHYITFDGVFYSFQGNCTYVLMEEITPKHNLKVTVDNVYCDPTEDVSCPRSIIVSYRSQVITLKNHNLIGEAKLEVKTHIYPWTEFVSTNKTLQGFA